MYKPALATVCSNTCSQMYVHIRKHSLARLATRFNPYFGWCVCLYVLFKLNRNYLTTVNLVDVPENALFVHCTHLTTCV